MAKYRAKIDIPPGIKAGEVHEFKDELLPEFAPHFEKVGDNEETVELDEDRKSLINPSRDELKARANELGITFASNIPTDKLLELVKEKEAENADEE